MFEDSYDHSTLNAYINSLDIYKTTFFRKISYFFQMLDSDTYFEDEPFRYLDRMTIYRSFLSLGYESWAHRWFMCCRKFIIVSCSHRELYLPVRCMLRVCPVCSEVRSRRLYAKYIDAMRNMGKIRFVTLTIGHMTLNCPEVISFHKKQVNALLKILCKDFPIRGGVIATELSKSFHLHFHLILDADFIPQTRISELWEEISGRYVVHISHVEARYGLGYVLNYTSKVPEFQNGIDYVNYCLKTKGSRLLSSFGNLYRLKRFKKNQLCNCEKHIGFCVIDPELKHKIESFIKDAG